MYDARYIAGQCEDCGGKNTCINRVTIACEDCHEQLDTDADILLDPVGELLALAELFYADMTRGHSINPFEYKARLAECILSLGGKLKQPPQHRR